MQIYKIKLKWRKEDSRLSACCSSPGSCSDSSAGASSSERWDGPLKPLDWAWPCTVLYRMFSYLLALLSQVFEIREQHLHCGKMMAAPSAPPFYLPPFESNEERSQPGQEGKPRFPYRWHPLHFGWIRLENQWAVTRPCPWTPGPTGWAQGHLSSQGQFPGTHPPPRSQLSPTLAPGPFSAALLCPTLQKETWRIKTPPTQKQDRCLRPWINVLSFR